MQWADGASGQLAAETFYGPEETLIKYSFDNVLIPPTRGDAYSRSLIFAVTRDGRLTDPAALPAGVQLNRPDGTSVFVNTEGASGNVFLNPAFCDDGHFDFTLPGAFGPSHTFQVGLATPDPTPAEQDAAATDLLIQALIVAGRYYSINGTFKDVDSTDLEVLWAGIDFVDGFEKTDTGVIAIEVTGDDELIVFIESDSGKFICAGDLVGSTTLFSEASKLEDLESACATTLPGDEETTTTSSTTTTTTP